LLDSGALAELWVRETSTSGVEIGVLPGSSGVLAKAAKN
jgi:hypothetical protein